MHYLDRLGALLRAQPDKTIVLFATATGDIGATHRADAEPWSGSRISVGDGILSSLHALEVAIEQQENEKTQPGHPIPDIEEPAPETCRTGDAP